MKPYQKLSYNLRASTITYYSATEQQGYTFYADVNGTNWYIWSYRLTNTSGAGHGVIELNSISQIMVRR